jgi:hypothetical protein
MQKTTVSEASIEGYFTKKFKAVFGRNGLLLKFHSIWFTGVPDRIVIVKDLPIRMVELKSSVGRLKPRQKVVHRILINLGIDVRTFGSKEEIDEYIEELKKHMK